MSQKENAMLRIVMKYFQVFRKIFFNVSGKNSNV